MNQKNMIIQNVIIKIFDKSEMQRLKSAFKTKMKKYTQFEIRAVG